MQVKLAPFLQAFAGFALRAGHDDLYLHIPLYGRVAASNDRHAHRHVHVVVYRYQASLALYLAVFDQDTKLRSVRDADWRIFGPVSEDAWLDSGAEAAVEAVLAAMRENLGCCSDAEASFLIPSQQFPQIFTGTPINLADTVAVAQAPRFNLY
jgi:hypothetical protein